MSQKTCGFLLITILLINLPGYTQDRSKEAEKYARVYCQMLAYSCSMAPKNLSIQVEKSIFNPNLKFGPVGWKIWSQISWRGQVSRMNYNIRVYIEVNEPVNGLQGKSTLFFLDYSYLLGFRCIKDENTKPARLLNGKIKFCRYREFKYFKL
ncbi:MAG: hypothetical protein NTY96_02490 [Bacteroidetes bacterium]|nr:hypothetical protein [Bacteroidota bacterium]